MASTVPRTLVEARFPDGIIRPCPSTNVRVLRPGVFPAAHTLIATVATDASGWFPATAVSDAVGTLLLLDTDYYQMGGGVLLATI